MIDSKLRESQLLECYRGMKEWELSRLRQTYAVDIPMYHKNHDVNAVYRLTWLCGLIDQVTIENHIKNK